MVKINYKESEVFTKREKEVIEFLLLGDTNKHIARKMDLQVVTVKLHVRNVCQKLNAKNRLQAVLILLGELEWKQSQQEL